MSEVLIAPELDATGMALLATKNIVQDTEPYPVSAVVHT